MKYSKLSKNKVSIVGLGKLGLPLMACFASRGFRVIGVDVNENIVKAVNKGEAPFFETDLQDFISKFKKNIRATQNHKEAIDETDITFVIVATPSDPRGNFSNKYVERALKSLAKSFKRSQKPHHLFVISSTVMPTSLQERLIPLIEKYSGKKLNNGFGVGYVPEFVALGRVIKDFLNPDLVIIGESDKFAGDQIISIYKRLCKNKPLISRMSLVSAEIAKVALNTYITTKISFVNTLANICEKIPGADLDSVTRATGADRRISPYYFKGGLSFGGTCFPRDTKSFIRFARDKGIDAGLIREVEKINKFQDNHLAEIVMKNLSSQAVPRVSILGLSFKPETPVIVNSPAIKLIKTLLKKRVKVIVYDPLAMENAKEVFGKKIEYAKTVKDCLSRAPFWVITTPAKEFKNINDGPAKGKTITILDCWRILNPQNFSKKVKYIRWGYA